LSPIAINQRQYKMAMRGSSRAFPAVHLHPRDPHRRSTLGSLLFLLLAPELYFVAF
jgi:hypothetical protein